MGVPDTGCSPGSCLSLGKQTQGCQEIWGLALMCGSWGEPGETQGRVWSGTGQRLGKWPWTPYPLPCSTPYYHKRAATPGLPGKGKWLEPARGEAGSHRSPGQTACLLSRSEEALGVRTPASVSPVSPQVQVLLYYLQHPPISFAELKRNTLYFSTDV